MISAQDVGVWLGIGLGTVATGFTVWKKQSRDATDIASNREERTWLVRSGKVLENERKRADEAVRRERETWEIHIKDAKEIAELRAENEALKRGHAELAKKIKSLQRIVHTIASDEQRRALGSDFGELDE